MSAGLAAAATAKLVDELRRRADPLDLDAWFTQAEISRAANNFGLFEQVEREAYERGRADADETVKA